MQNEPLLIYVPQVTPRIEYIFSTLLEAIGIRQHRFTRDAEHFRFNLAPRINYSNTRITNEELWVKPCGLLSQKNIQPQQPGIDSWKGHTTLFPQTEGDIPFDLFGAAFFLLSRYEEYLPHQNDAYGRFAHTNSIAFTHKFLDQPLVNRWLYELRTLLGQRFRGLLMQPAAFHFLPTYDIDIAWSYLHKGWLRNGGGFIVDLLLARWKNIAQRTRVLLSRRNDPYDVYSWLDGLHRQYHLKPIYFFLLGRRRTALDKNIDVRCLAMQRLIVQHDQQYGVGIHPSWQSGNKHALMKKEIQQLHELTGKKINKSRQHYIRFSLPDTFRRLIEAGITEDYSMGYGSINGFRASYCLPFQWYDLQKEEITPLTLYPFCFMDANAIFEEKISAADAFNSLMHYAKSVREVNGLMITIFHNSFLANDEQWMEWRQLYANGLDAIGL